MMNIWITAMYELRKVSRIRSVMFVLFLLPLVLICILGAALSGQFRAEDVKLKPVKTVVVNNDQSRWNGELKRLLDSPDLKGILAVTEADSREQAIQAIRSGSAEFGVIVPAGFGDRLMQGKAAEWEFVAGGDPGQNLIAQTVFDSYIAYANGLQAAVLTAGPAATPQLADLQETMAREKAASFVKVGRLAGEQKQFSAVQYYAAAMTVMFLLYSGMTAAISIVSERANHTLARLGAMPVRMEQIMAGKMLGNGLLALIQSAVIVGVSRYALGVDWGGRPDLLFLACLLLILASMSLAALIGAYAASMKTVTAMFQILIILMTFLSGGFGPDMGEWISRLAPFTVSHWGMQSILRLMLDGASPSAMQSIGILAAIAAGLAAVSALAYRKVGYHE